MARDVPAGILPATEANTGPYPPVSLPSSVDINKRCIPNLLPLTLQWTVCGHWGLQLIHIASHLLNVPMRLQVPFILSSSFTAKPGARNGKWPKSPTKGFWKVWQLFKRNVIIKKPGNFPALSIDLLDSLEHHGYAWYHMWWWSAFFIPSEDPTSNYFLISPSEKNSYHLNHHLRPIKGMPSDRNQQKSLNFSVHWAVPGIIWVWHQSSAQLVER